MEEFFMPTDQVMWSLATKITYFCYIFSPVALVWGRWRAQVTNLIFLHASVRPFFMFLTSASLFSFSPTLTPLTLAVNKSSVIYILSPALDGLWRKNRKFVNRLVILQFILCCFFKTLWDARAYHYLLQGQGYANESLAHSLTVREQPPPQALRFSHGRGERETSDWWWERRLGTRQVREYASFGRSENNNLRHQP